MRIRDGSFFTFAGRPAENLRHQQAESRRRGDPIPSRLPADSPVFNVPSGLIRVLNRDLKAAAIPKVDERGRQVDVHALRHTFGTLLSKRGVARSRSCPPRS